MKYHLEVEVETTGNKFWGTKKFITCNLSPNNGEGYEITVRYFLGIGIVNFIKVLKVEREYMVDDNPIDPKRFVEFLRKEVSLCPA